MYNPFSIATKIIIDSIEEELCLKLSKNKTHPSIDNPIEIKNNLGKFKYQGNGRLLVHPNQGVEYIVLNINTSYLELKARKKALDVNFLGHRLCKQKGCPSDSDEFSDYCTECYEEKYN